MTENAEINPNKTPQPKSRLDFVFVDHGSENVSRIIDAIVESDGDIIAIEKLRDGFGQGTYEQKHCDSEAATAMLKARDEGGEPEDRVLGEDGLLNGLVQRLKGSDKRVVFIDIATDDPGYELYERYLSTGKLLEQALQSGVDDEAAQDLSDDFLILKAQLYDYREGVMKQQIEALIDENPGKKITVMSGMLHTPISYEVKQGVRSRRTFVLNEQDRRGLRGGESARFSAEEQILRLLRHQLGQIGLKYNP